MDYETFLQWRLACKQFYLWTLSMTEPWMSRLCKFGPKTVGPLSVHMPFQCRKGDNCRSTRHYVPSTLVPRLVRHFPPYVQVVLSAMHEIAADARRCARTYNKPEDEDAAGCSLYERRYKKFWADTARYRHQWWKAELARLQLEKRRFLQAFSKLTAQT